MSWPRPECGSPDRPGPRPPCTMLQPRLLWPAAICAVIPQTGTAAPPGYEPTWLNWMRIAGSVVVTVLVVAWGASPGIGKSTLCAGLSEWLSDAGLQVDHFQEEEILTRPQYADVASHFLATGEVEREALLSATARFADSVLAAGTDVVIADALMPVIAVKALGLHFGPPPIPGRAAADVAAGRDSPTRCALELDDEVDRGMREDLLPQGRPPAKVPVHGSSGVSTSSLSDGEGGRRSTTKRSGRAPWRTRPWLPAERGCRALGGLFQDGPRRRAYGRSHVLRLHL